MTNPRLCPAILLAVSVAVGCGYAVPSVAAAPSRAVAAGTNVAFAAHLAQLQPRVPTGFTVIVQPPFVVLGDEAPERVRRRAIDTVQWAVDRIRQDFFPNDPAEIIDIWLFRDRESYTNFAWRLFGDRPDTPFGYYSSVHQALIMNISTGGGTLVHEIVHPFMRANFPRCPSWFNEGLASLYEQASERNGHICGLVNWRLPGLQEAIRAGKLMTFQQLTATTDDEFYCRDSGGHYSEHYAQARYLCYYLQEKGLLARYYKQFQAGAQHDPTGYETLQRVLAEKDMDGFQKKWQQFVLGLQAP